MSWKFGGVYIKPGFKNPEEALRFLNIDKRFTYETVAFAAVVNSAFADTAIGYINGVSLVHDNWLPYNNSYDAGTFTDADYTMKEQSNTADIVSFFLDGITESYGWNHFSGGERIQRYAVMGGNLVVAEGSIVPPAGERNEAIIIRWLQEFAGINFQHLLKKENVNMYRFSETGF